MAGDTMSFSIGVSEKKNPSFSCFGKSHGDLENNMPGLKHFESRGSKWT